MVEWRKEVDQAIESLEVRMAEEIDAKTDDRFRRRDFDREKAAIERRLDQLERAMESAVES